MADKEREGSAVKLGKVREEGILLGQQQQRAYREEELNKYAEMAKMYKARAEELENARNELEQYNKF